MTELLVSFFVCVYAVLCVRAECHGKRASERMNEQASASFLSPLYVRDDQAVAYIRRMKKRNTSQKARFMSSISNFLTKEQQCRQEQLESMNADVYVYVILLSNVLFSHFSCFIYLLDADTHIRSYALAHQILDFMPLFLVLMCCIDYTECGYAFTFIYGGYARVRSCLSALTRASRLQLKSACTLVPTQEMWKKDLRI